MKKIWIITLFEDLFTPFVQTGVIGKALRGERGEGVAIHFVNPSNFNPKHFKGVDDHPYGGGQGVVMRADVLETTLLQGVVSAGGYPENWRDSLTVICPAPRGKVWSAALAREFAQRFFVTTEKQKDIVFICGRYEGIDERFLELYVDEFYSLGDFILSGGELAVMAMIDSSLRFVPGILGHEASPQEESFEDGLLEFPLYTRPRVFQGKEVPAVLTEGDPKKIRAYLNEAKEKLNQDYRPDLWSQHGRKKNET